MYKNCTWYVDCGVPVSMRLLESKDLIRRVVIDAAGHAIGEVTGLIIDFEEWKVAALQLRLRKEVADSIGVERSRFRAPSIAIPADLVMGVADTVVLKVSAAGLRVGAAGAARPEQPSPGR